MKSTVQISNTSPTD